MSSLAVWGTLAFFLVCGVAGTVLVAMRALALWRGLRGLKRAVGDGLAQLADVAEELERRLSAGVSDTEELSTALGRLAESRRRLALLTTAAHDATTLLGRVTAVYPRK